MVGSEKRQSQGQQIANFLSQLRFQVGDDFEILACKFWPEALFELVKVVKNTPRIIVFDEFQWMASYRTQLVSTLKMVWDQYLSQIDKVTLILCGSIASFMIKKVIKSKALYGRIYLEINLRPFKLSEAAKFLPGRGDLEILEAYILLGGIPQYLKLISSFSSIQEGISELAFSPEGYFFNEYNRIFISHFGKNASYQEIVELLSKHPYGLMRKVLADSDKTSDGGTLTSELYNLETAGLITSVIPFNKKSSSKQIKYFLSDPYLKFYLKFIETNKKEIKSNHKNIANNIFQSANYLSWRGYSFENVCVTHAHIISRILGFNGINYRVGPFFRPHDGLGGVQIDLLFDRDDNVITLCEIKYKNSNIGADVINETEKKAEILRSITKKTVQKVLITLSAPTRELTGSGYFYKVINASELIS